MGGKNEGKGVVGGLNLGVWSLMGVANYALPKGDKLSQRGANNPRPPPTPPERNPDVYAA